MKRKKFSTSIRIDVAATQKWCCAMCNGLLYSTFEIDHVIPLHRGGNDAVDNLQALCPNCHRLKTRKEMQLYHAVERGEVSPYFLHPTIEPCTIHYFKKITHFPPVE